jgi:hypothetical protein
MREGWKLLIVLVVLAGSGALRMPLEARLTRGLAADHLLPERLALGTREKLGQTSAVVALGGLRTLIAALLNLRAFGFFERQDWFRLEDTFDTIVTLAPRSVYYWDTGSWHLAYNAAAHYLVDRAELPPLRRRQLWRDAIERGIAMLEHGIRNNPHGWVLPYRLGRLHEDPNKLTDYRQALRWFDYASERGAPAYVRRGRLWSLARVPGREAETLAFARSLFADPVNRVPTLNCVLFAAESRADPQRPPAGLIDTIFKDRRQAWDQLRLYHDRTIKALPQDGVEQALRWLQDQIDVPANERLGAP